MAARWQKARYFIDESGNSGDLAARLGGLVDSLRRRHQIQAKELKASALNARPQVLIDAVDQLLAMDAPGVGLVHDPEEGSRSRPRLGGRGEGGRPPNGRIPRKEGDLRIEMLKTSAIALLAVFVGWDRIAHLTAELVSARAAGCTGSFLDDDRNLITGVTFQKRWRAPLRCGLIEVSTEMAH